VRGVFDTREAAQEQAKKLSITDSTFHVFVGQVGYWLPWDPNADKIEDEHFTDSQLNQLMQKYKENNVNKDIFYEEQKRDKIRSAQEERLRAEKEKKAAESLEDVSEKEAEFEPCVESVDEPCVESVDEPCVESVDEPCSIVSDEPAPQSDLERALTSEDPWMQQKNNASNQ